jgi:regulator of nucleoside diphosphate kinase
MNDHPLLLTRPDFARLMALRPDERLRADLDRAVVVAPEAVPAGIVTVGSDVRYLDEYAGVSRRIRLVYPEDADAGQGRVSVLAPVGAALIGLAVGQHIDWEFPSGEVRRLRVEEVVDTG